MAERCSASTSSDRQSKEDAEAIEVIRRLSSGLANPERVLAMSSEIKELLDKPQERAQVVAGSARKLGRVNTRQRIEYVTGIQSAWRGNKVRNRDFGGMRITYDQYDGYQYERTTSTDPASSAGSDPGPPQLEDFRPASSSVMRSLGAAAQAEMAATLEQVGGHGMLRKAVSMQGVLVKQGPVGEMAIYQELQGTSLEPHVPAYHGGHDHNGVLCDLRLQDLTFGMKRPCVMDIKVGKRTFLESEVKNTKLRPDLAQKMFKLDPQALTESERTDGVTKLRYMQFRESVSSTATLGWRIEGASVPPSGPAGYDFKKLRDREELRGALSWYLQHRPALHAAYLARLLALRDVLTASPWFARHEVVGSSLLFVYDDDDAQPSEPLVKMIDFAKTEGLSEGVLSHRADWVVGNREDGYLAGVDNLIGLWESLAFD